MIAWLIKCQQSAVLAIHTGLKPNSYNVFIYLLTLSSVAYIVHICVYMKNEFHVMPFYFLFNLRISIVHRNILGFMAGNITRTKHIRKKYKDRKNMFR